MNVLLYGLQVTLIGLAVVFIALTIPTPSAKSWRTSTWTMLPTLSTPLSWAMWMT